MCFVSILNTLSQYTYFYISKKHYFMHFFASKAFIVSLRVLGQLDAHKSKEPKIRGSEED